MNPRFLALIFAGCTIVFAGVWAATAPSTPAAAPAADAPPALLYADCDAVRAANAAPLHAGQPGYRPALDPNMNGIACEPVGAADTGGGGSSYVEPEPTQDAPVMPPAPPKHIDPAAPPGALAPALPVEM